MERPVEVLLDSVILIDHLNGIGAAEAYLAGIHSRAAISVVTRAEVLTGIPVERWSGPLRLLGSFPLLVIDGGIADESARLRSQHRLKLPDAFQAALAQHHGLRLATRNTRDVPEERYPFVVVPYRV